MRKRFFNEFLYQVFALIVAAIAVHAVYVTVIRPRATEIIAEQALRVQEEFGYTPERTIWVLIRDYEQEACFILMLWAFAIMAYKAYVALNERSLLQQNFLHVREGVKILPEDTREYSRALQSLPERTRNTLLPRVLLAALERFGSTKSVQDVSSVANSACDSESERLESELSMIRYIAWAIPSIGFIGTVRGIGAALGEAHRAVEGDIAGVTENLGIAFNSTFVALMISIVVMFLVHQLQLLQERLVFDTQTYVDHNLIRHMQTRD
ncbi:MAG TPA: MotA/TolQ/ExbB proton channel family protein [Gammaproteobacteria bacterium]|nr:MotA/TolQ/ExbB proton channel family protein [Gammaproteobacteria bacterium]